MKFCTLPGFIRLTPWIVNWTREQFVCLGGNTNVVDVRKLQQLLLTLAAVVDYAFAITRTIGRQP